MASRVMVKIIRATTILFKFCIYSLLTVIILPNLLLMQKPTLQSTYQLTFLNNSDFIRVLPLAKISKLIFILYYFHWISSWNWKSRTLATLLSRTLILGCNMNILIWNTWFLENHLLNWTWYWRWRFLEKLRLALFLWGKLDVFS